MTERKDTKTFSGAIYYKHIFQRAFYKDLTDSGNFPERSQNLQSRL